MCVVRCVHGQCVRVLVCVLEYIYIYLLVTFFESDHVFLFVRINIVCFHLKQCFGFFLVRSLFFFLLFGNQDTLIDLMRVYDCVSTFRLFWN